MSALRACIIATNALLLFAANAAATPASQPTGTVENLAAGFKEVASVFGGAGLGGVLVGVYQYFKSRQRFPRASISHTISHYRISGEHWLLRVRATVRNEGQTLLQIGNAQGQVYQILPVPENIAKMVQVGQSPLPAGKAEAPWPALDKRAAILSAEEHELEPGEVDDFFFDFFLSQDAKTVMVHTHFENLAKKKRGIGWNKDTMYDVEWKE